jgi:hypothetical protein
MITHALKRFYLNYRPPYLREKLIVFESDDWGSIRMSSHKALESLRRAGSPVDSSPYAPVDALECDEDLMALYDILGKFRGGDGRPVKFTLNNIMGNPDFDKIRDSHFQEYYWEPFSVTLQRYPSHANVLKLYREGMDEGLIQVQFHGKDHVNVNRWMRDLQAGNTLIRLAFDHGVFSFPEAIPPRKYWNEYMDAFGMDELSELESKKKVLKEGIDFFSSFWGFSSRSMIAPCYVWHSSLEDVMSSSGIDTIQGIPYQYEPVHGMEQVRKFHYFGQKGPDGIRYFIRNAAFEPFLDHTSDWLNICLGKIRTAFNFGKPAIITSHRANFIGFLDPSNRKKNLEQLGLLLSEIVKRWPDVRFVSTDELSELISK